MPGQAGLGKHVACGEISEEGDGKELIRRCESWPDWQGRGDICPAAGGGLPNR